MNKKIIALYNKEAEKFGTKPMSTMPDIFVRRLELKKIEDVFASLVSEKKNLNVLDVGSGNGYTIKKLAKKYKFQFTGIDINRKMINVASKNNLKNLMFKVDNVLSSKLKSKNYDIILSERCLINLLTWNEQKTALNQVFRLLKSGGYYLMLEAFDDGLKALNGARKSLNLNPILPAWHNYYFKKKRFEHFIKNKFQNGITKSKINYSYDNFLSSYYFGSRVLYPALISSNSKIIYNNKFVEFFSMIPSVGNYSQIQLCILQKMN